jgi:hypothetical protein
MANYQELKRAIANVIKTNGNQEITGAILQNVLKSMVSVIGENATFAGIAIPGTNPGTPDANVFYIAAETGSYPNFGGSKVITDNEIAIFNLEHGSWIKYSIPVIKTSRAARIEAQQNYLFAAATSRNANIVATGYYQALIDAYIPLTPIAGAKYYLTVLNKTSKTLSLYYTTTGESSGNTNVYDFREDSTYGNYTLMKTMGNNDAWVIIDWNKMVDNASGYYEGMELNPRVFKNPNYDSLLAMINTANSNISAINSDISEINGSINETDSVIDVLMSKLGLTYSGFTLKETLPKTAISERGETFTSSLEKSTVLKLSTGLEDGTASIFLKFNGYNIGNSYYAIKGHDGENLKVEKPTQVDTEISFTGDVSEVWIVVSSDDTSYSGYVLSGDISIDIPPTDFSSIINTVISEDTLTGLLVANKRTNLETGALQPTTMFSYYKYAIPKGALKVKTKLTTYPNCGLCFYDEDGAYISGLNATTAEGGGQTIDYNGKYYEVDIPAGAASLKNSVLTTGDGSYWIAYSAGDMTFIFDNLESNIQEQIDKINEKIEVQSNPVYLPTFPQVANFMPPKKELTNQIKILFIGSSWLINTYWYLNKITQAAGINALIKTAFIAGGSFSQWIDAYNNNTAVSGYSSENGSDWSANGNTVLSTLFAEQDWDIVCFQQGALVGRIWDNYEGYWKDWLSIIRRNINSKAILCYNATWTPAINIDGIYTPSKMADLTPYNNDRDGQALWQKDNNENIAKFTTLAGLQAYIAPCGAAVYAARRHPDLKDDNHDLADDGIHLNSGMPAYIPAATWYETFLAPIYGISIDTITWIPDEETQKCAVSWDNYTAMTEQHRQEICKIVKLAASDRLGLRVL